MGWIGCIRHEKNLTRLRGTNFCTSSEHFAPSFVRQLNGPKCTQMVRNAPKHEFRVQWGGSGAFVAKCSCHKVASEFFATNAPDPHPFVPKLTFWCISYHLGASRTIWLSYETRCKTARTSAKVRATKSRQDFSQRTLPDPPHLSLN